MLLSWGGLRALPLPSLADEEGAMSKHVILANDHHSTGFRHSLWLQG